MKFQFDEIFNRTSEYYEDKKFYNVTKIRLGLFEKNIKFFDHMTFTFFDDVNFIIDEIKEEQGWVEVVPPTLTISNYIKIEGHTYNKTMFHGFSEIEVFGNKEGSYFKVFELRNNN